MKNKYFALTLLFIFVLIKEANPNQIVNDIKLAERFITEKDYKAAMDLLTPHISSKNERIEEILKLVNIIENKKLEIINASTMIMNLFSRNEFEEADKLSKTLDITGNFDTDTNFIITRIQSLQTTISERVEFVNILQEIEKNIVEYDLKDGITNAERAASIYNQFISPELSKRFNDQTDSINASGVFEYPEYRINTANDFAEAARLLKIVNDRLSLYEQQTADLSAFYQSQIDKETDSGKRLALSAYKASSERLTEIIIRTTQRNYRRLLNEIFAYSEELIEKKDSLAIQNLLYLNSFIERNNLQRFAFYKNKIDLNDSRLFSRSKMNLYDYLTFISKKDRLYYRYNEQQLLAKTESLENTLKSHRGNIEEGELIKAGETLKLLTDGNSEIRGLKDGFESTISSAFFDTPLNKTHKTSYEVLTKRINLINESIYDERAKLENTRIMITNLLASGEAKLRNADAEYRRQSYDNAITSLQNARTDFIEVTTMTRSQEIERRVEQINRRITEIETEVFRRDIELAEKYVQDARRFLYNDNYLEANNEIKKAQELYIKHNQRSEFADNLQQRVETAIKLRREVTLNFDDAAYKNIIEWYENAVKSLENKDYARAELFKDKILSEKPFYEKARELEIRILLARGDMEFFRTKYNSYFSEAMNYYNEGNFTRALNAFTQLLQYNYDTERLKQLIYNCNLRLGLIARPVQTVDRGRAVNLAERARRAYESGDFKTALELINQAIAVWEDVPGASTIRVGSLRRLHQPLPGLSVENERKYVLATRAYAEENYRRVVELTDEILASEKSEKVTQLNSNAKRLLIIRERGL